MKKIWHKFSEKSRLISSFIFLHIAYYIGIGITSVIAKISGKHFLDSSLENSTWVKRNENNEIDRMY
jgi:hypothetical protein